MTFENDAEKIQRRSRFWRWLLVPVIFVLGIPLLGVLTYVLSQSPPPVRPPQTAVIEGEKHASKSEEDKKKPNGHGPQHGEGQNGHGSQQGEKRADDAGNRSSADAEDAAFDRRARKIATLYRAARPEEQSKLRQELEALNDRHFEYRQQQRKQEIDTLSGRIDSLRVLQIRRQQNKVEVLKRRMNELIDPDANLDWEVPGSKKEESPSTAGVGDQAENSSVKNPTAPTYQGKTFEEWIAPLDAERSPEKLAQAVMALQQLSDYPDPRLLVRTILQISRRRTVIKQADSKLRPEQIPHDYAILHGSVEILLASPPEIVVDELISEFNGLSSGHPSAGFQLLVDYFFESLINFSDGSSRHSFQNRQSEFPNVSLSSVKALSQELRRRSRRMVSALAKMAQQDEVVRDWVVGCSGDILKLSGQPMTIYADLIPVVERAFGDTKSSRRDVAADLLAKSGLKVAEVLMFSEAELKALHFTGDERPNYEEVTKRIVDLYPQCPDDIYRIIDERWKEYLTNSPGGDGQRSLAKCMTLIFWLGSLGDDANGAIPFLRKFEQSLETHPTDQKNVAKAIKQIEEGKPRPKFEPLPEDDADDANRTNSLAAKPIRSSPKSLNTVGDVEKKTINDSPKVSEKTFDGTAYWQWLKMLETEQKPEKLAAAMDASSRLADPQDEHRIARQIFLGASLFEKSDSAEQEVVWQAAGKSLNRLPSSVVAEEMIAALRDHVSFKTGRKFQGRFLAELASEAFIESDQREAEFLREVVEHASPGGHASDYLLAGASRLWIKSGRNLADFEPLESLFLKMLSDGPTTDRTAGGGAREVTWEWWFVGMNLAKHAPDTPELAATLVKYANMGEVVQLLGMMGRHAESAVPVLLEMFLEDFNKIGDANNSPRRTLTQPEMFEQKRRDSRRTSLINALCDIGGDPKSYALFRQLVLTLPVPTPASGFDPGNDQRLPFYQSAERGLLQFAKSSTPVSEFALLNDHMLINGSWTVKSSSDQTVPPGAAAVARNRILRIGNSKSDGAAIGAIGGTVNQFEIDATKSPRQISMSNVDFPQGGRGQGSFGTSTGLGAREIPGTRREGIYELKETTLRLQFAKIGDPRPAEFVKDMNDLSEGQILLEFERKLDDRFTKPE